MRRALAVVASALLATGMTVAQSPLATAAPSDDLSGAWNSAALRAGDPGYSMKVISQSTPPAAYTVVLRFHYQDGRLGPRIKAGMASNGRKATLLLAGKGAMADQGNPHLMQGTVGQDGSLYFPTCYKELRFISKKQAPQACLFQQFPA